MKPIPIEIERFGGLRPFEFHHLPDEMRDDFMYNGYNPGPNL